MHELEERNADLEHNYAEIVERNASLQQQEHEFTSEIKQKTRYGLPDSRTKVLIFSFKYFNKMLNL